MRMLWAIIIGIAIGAISGWLAGKIMKSEGSLLRNIILGIVGGFVGSFLLGLVGISGAGYIGSIIVSVIGACVLIWVGKFINKK